MVSPIMIEDFVKNIVNSYLNILIIFVLVVLVTSNLKDMTVNYIIGCFIKIFKSYRPRDILEINGKNYYIDNLNTYRIKFLKVVKFDNDNVEITLSREELSIGYSVFLKMKIIRVGRFSSY